MSADDLLLSLWYPGLGPTSYILALQHWHSPTFQPSHSCKDCEDFQYIFLLLSCRLKLLISSHHRHSALANWLFQWNLAFQVAKTHTLSQRLPFRTGQASFGGPICFTWQKCSIAPNKFPPKIAATKLYSISQQASMGQTASNFGYRLQSSSFLNHRFGWARTAVSTIEYGRESHAKRPAQHG